MVEQAGPSRLSMSTATAHVSFRDIFEHLELARHQRDADQLQSILTSRKAKLKSCLQPFPSPPDHPNDAQNKPGLRQQICQEIAQRYSLSSDAAADELDTFLLSEGRDLEPDTSTPPTASPTKRRNTVSAKSAKSASTHSADLLDAFNIFYFEERMYLLRTVSSLIRITEDAQHPYFDLASTILALFADEAFALECVAHFQKLADLSLSESVRQQPRYSSLWAKQILREQFGLLEIVFLLFYGRLSPSSSSILVFLRAVQGTQAGTRQANLGFFDDEASETVICISHLLVLIGIEMLGLEEVMDGFDLSNATELRLVQDPQLLGQILDLLENTGADPMQSPILVAWALVLHRLEDALVSQHERIDNDRTLELPEHLTQLTDTLSTDDGGPSIWRRLAQAAFAPEMQLFDIMMSMLASPLLTSSNGASTPAVAGPSALAYRAVFKGLLLSITELVKPEFLPNFDALVGLWEATFGSGIALELSPAAIDGVAALCDQFWQIDSQYDSRRTTLDTARRRWPVSFRPLVRLLKALSGHARVDALAAYPSLLDDRPRSEVEERACAAVFDYLSRLPTFAQVLPMGANAPGAPFETMEGGDYTSVTYRITRPVRIPGTQVRLSPGTTGSTISELGKAPVIVLWSPSRPVSAWKVMRDVLACFPPHTPANAHTDARVFDDDQSSMNFDRLAPAEAGSAWEELASEMLDLFTSVVSASSDLAWTLLAHLEGRDLGEDDISIDYEPAELEQIQQEKQELAQAKSLSTIALHLLSHALVASPINTRLVQSANKLLTVLLPYEADNVWQEIRSSNVLFGSPGTLPYLSALRVPTSSALLTHEVARASYGGLLSLLDFHLALFHDLSRSFSTSSPEVLEVKTSVLLRSLGWVFECIWPEYQSWRYARLADRLHIGQKCTLLLETVLSERSWKPESPAAAKLVEAVEHNLVTQPSMLGLAPLITCLGNGQQLLDQLNRAGRQADVLLAEQWISSSLRLASLVVSRRRELTLAALHNLSTLPAETARKAVQARVDLGLFEKLFFDHTIVASRATYGAGRKSSRIELANAIFGYVLLPSSSQINVEATHLITLILRSLADLSAVGKQAPGLVGHLGTLAELEATLSGLVELVGNAHLDTGLRADVWTMLAAIVDTQPALGTLLLTGRHLAKTTESRLTQRGDKDSTPSALTYGQALRETALDAASAVVLRWRKVVHGDAQLLEAVLRFLDVAWAHAAEHVAAFDTIRAKPVFFQALADIVAGSLAAPSTDAQAFVDDSHASPSTCHESVAAYAHRRMCQARALRLLERDIQLGNWLKDQDKPAASSQASLDAFLSILTQSERMLEAMETSFAMPCDPSLRILLELKLAELFPTMDLDSLRHPQRKDDFDMARRYGDDYHYSLDSFRRKLEGLLGTMNREEAKELGIVEEGLLSIITINLEWSCIDVQNSLLQAWNLCIESTMGRVVAEALGSNRMHALEKSAITTWTRLATIAADEGREGNFMRGAHATRLSLLSTLMELAWGHGASKDASSEDQIVQASTICGRLLMHPVFSVDESLKGVVPPAFHRDAFEMVLLTTVRIRTLLKSDSAIAQPRESTVERHSALHLSIDLFCRHAVQALRLVVDSALRYLQGGQAQSEAARLLEDDLDMLVGIFEMTTRRDLGADSALWLPLLQESQLLQTSIDLLSRAPVLRSDAVADAVPNPNTAHHILFMAPLLSMLLTIASQPVSSEDLALQGVINGLTSNMLSDALEAGQISALLLSGDRNPSHDCWTMMLRIVVALIDNLGGASDVGNWTGASGRFVETDVLGFVRVYYQQIDRALDLTVVQSRLGSGTSTFGQDVSGADQVLSMGQLDELELVSRLFYSLTRAEAEAISQSRAPRSPTTNHLATKAAWVLQPLVHLLQHPRELCSLLGWDKENEEARVAGERIAMAKLREIVAVLITALWTHTQSATVLCREMELWPSTKSGCAVIRPTTRTSTTQTATIGTLLDLASYLTDHLRTLPKQEHYEGGVLEQTLGLAATQIAIWTTGKSKEHDDEAQWEQMARQEVEAGISRDLGSALRAAQDVSPATLYALLSAFVDAKLTRI